MQYANMTIDGFGSLKGEIAFQPGLNLILAPNESGKSTLAAAMQALLYGVHEHRGKSERRYETEDKDSYSPWSGHPYRISGTIRRQNGTILNIWRDLEAETLRVLDMETGQERTEAFQHAKTGDRLGEELLHLSRSQFERIAFVREGWSPSTAGLDEFSDTLARLLSSQDTGGQSVQRAIAVLQQARDRFDGVTSKSQGAIKLATELSRLASQIDALNAERSTLESHRQRVEQEFAQHTLQANRRQAIERNIAECDYLANQARVRELRQTLESRQTAAERLADLSAEAQRLAPLADRQLDQSNALGDAIARYTQRQTRIDEIDALLARTRAELSLLAPSESAPRRAPLPKESIQSLRVELETIRRLDTRLHSVDEDEHQARNELAKAGLSPEEATHALNREERLSPGDHAFLVSARAQQQELEERESAIQSHIARIDLRIQEIERHRRDATRGARTHIAFATILMTLSVVAFLAFNMMWVVALPGIFCLLWLVYGVWKLPSAGRLLAERLEDDLQQRHDLHKEAASLPEQTARIEETLQRLAEQEKMTPDDLLDEVARVRGASHSIHTWQAVRTRRTELQRDRETALHSAKRTLAHAGWISENDSLSPEMLQRWIQEADAIQQEHQNADALRTRIVDSQEEASRLRQQQHETSTQIIEILNAGGIDSTTPHPVAQDAYRDAARQQQRLRQLRDDLLPTATQAAGSPEENQSLSDELERRQALAASQRAAMPHLNSLVPDEPALTYERRRSDLDSQLDADASGLAEAETALAVAMNDYRKRMPQILNELAQLQAARIHAERFDQASSLALESLERIAGDVHARWSPRLAQQLNTVMHRYAPGWALRLSRDLSLHAEAADGHEPMDEAALLRHLSSGTRDQLFLSLRLILALNLGQDEPIPLILDDPLIHADDQRFRECLRFLLDEVAPKTQVILFSCHKERHETFVRETPGLEDACLALPG